LILHGSDSLLLTANQFFHFERDERYQREWKVTTDGYAYHVRLSEEPSGELFQWHWHPQRHREECHLHVGAISPFLSDLHKKHIPSHRIAFEEVLLFLIREIHVLPIRSDWEAILADSQARFEAFRTWAGTKKG
jgi:hypothetical protein